MRKLLFSAIGALLLFTGNLSAQLTGLKNIPGDYPTLAAAILDLNTQGVGPGGVSFNHVAGNPEVAPAGGYSITATGTAANPIIFTGNGNLITAAPSPVAGDRADAIFKLIGSDYITLQGYSMSENPGNTIGGAIGVQQMTEFGVALFAASVTDGAQNNTIQANSINLTSSANYQNAIGIFSTSSSSSTNAAQAATSTAGTNSNNKFYANLISGVAYGMYFICEPITATITESGTDVGGAVSFSGNQITFGNNTTSDIGWTRFSATTQAGIVFRNGAGYSARFNQITAVSSLTHANAGVFASGTAPTGVTYTSTVSDNTISLNNVGVTAMSGIDFGFGIANGTLVANTNNITLTQASSVSTSAAIFGIKANYTSATNTANSNTVTINQVALSGANSSVTNGISVAGTSTTLTVSLNNITLNQGSNGSGTITGSLTAIDVAGGSTTNNVLTNTILVDQTTSVATGITNNIVGIRATSAATTLNITTNNAITFRQAVSGAGTYGTGTAAYISMNAAHGAVNITGNNFNTSGSTLRATGNMDCILGGGTTITPGLVNIKNNTANIDRVATAGNVGFYTQTSTAPNDPADTISVNMITFTNIATSGNVTVINRLGGSVTATKNVCNNTISVSGTTVGTVVGIAAGYSANQRVSGNSITLNTMAVRTVGITFISFGGNGVTIRMNTISCTTGSTAPTAAMGIEINTSATGPMTITGNAIAINMTGVINAATTARGISLTMTGTNTITDNVISSISVGAAGSTGSMAIDGIAIFSGTTNAVSRNKIYGLTTQGTGTTTVVSGITLAGGTTNNVSNNLIGLLTAPASASPDAIRGINITSTSASTTHNVYYNTVRIAATSTGANFGTSGIFHTVSATASTSTLNLRNNLIVNTSTAAGTGLTVAYRRSGTALNNYASTSNNNSFYAGAPSATNLIFNDGTNSDQTLVAYQGRVTPLDAASLSENPAFSSLVGSSPAFLHIPAATATLLESGGGVIPSFTTDYDNDARPGPVGSVNGGAIAPDIGGDEFDGVLISCTGTPTAGTATITPGFRCGPGTFVLNVPTASSGAGISYSWQQSAVSGGPYTPVAGGTTQSFTTAVVSTTTYYVLVVTCATSGLTATSTEVAGIVYPATVAGVTPTSSTFCSPGPGVVLTATGGTTYAWLPAAGLSSTTGSPVTASPTTTTVYTVTVTDANGCTGTATATVTSAAAPTVTATATPASVCSGGNSQLQATATIPVTSYAVTSIPYAPTTGTGTQAVTGDDAMSGAITLPFTFNFYGANYTQVFVCTNGFIQLGTSSGTTTVYGPTMPTAGNPNTIIAGVWSDLNIVPGQVTTYVTGTAPNRVFTVYYNNVQFYHNTNPGNVVGNANYQILLYETSNIVEVHVNNVTGATTTTPVTKTMGIENATGTSAVTPAGRNAGTWTVGAPEAWRFVPNTGTYTYAWTPPTFLTSTTIANPMAQNVTATTTYVVTATELSGCTGTASVTLTAGSALSGSASISPASTVCEGTNVTFNATPIGGGSPYTYSWSGPNSFASTQQNPVINGVTVAAAGTYSLTITDACAATSVHTVTLTVLPVPGATVTPTSATYCNPGPVVSLTATGAGTYAWLPAAGLSATTGANVDASPSSTTTYTVTVTSAGGCTSTATTTITSAPAVTGVAATASQTTICAGDTIDLSSTATSPIMVMQQTFTTGLGAWTVVNGPSSPAVSNWANRVSPYTYDGPSVDFTNFSTPNGGNFYMSDADIGGSGTTTNTQLISPVFSLAGMTSANLSLEHIYQRWASGDNTVAIQISTDGGLNYSNLQVYTSDQGVVTANAQVCATPTISLAAYLGQSNLRIRFNYISTWGYYWLVDNIVVSAVPAYTYAWTSAPVGFTSSVQNPTDVVPAATTTYSVTVTNAAGCSAGGSVAVTVNPLPVVTLSGTNEFCAGDSSLLTGTSGGTSQWYMNGSPIAGATNNTYYATAAGVYNMVKTNANGCEDSSATNITVTVNALPTVTASATASAVCAGTPVTFNGGGATSYAWTGGVTDNVAYTPVSTDTYTVTGTDGNGCTNTASVTVTVNALPTVVANATATAVCDGSPVTLSGSGATSYTWTASVTDNVPFTPTVTDTYTVTGTDGNGCTNTDMVTVTVNTLPTVSATATDDTICSGTAVTLNGNGATSYVWTGGVTDNVAFTPVATDTYTVTGTDGNGCTNTTSIEVVVNASPVVTLALTQDTACQTAGNIMLMGETPAGGTWSGPGVTGNMFDPVASGLGMIGVTYMYMDINGCSSSAVDSIWVGICTDVPTVATGSIKLYPNPNEGVFTIQLPSAPAAPVTVEVTNELGQVVDAFTMTGTTKEVNLGTKEGGVYFVRITDGTTVTVHRVVKQ